MYNSFLNQIRRQIYPYPIAGIPVSGSWKNMIPRRNLLTAFFFLYLLASSQSLDFPIPKRKHKIDGPIKTVVVVVMENRSFDHMLGWLKRTRPDIDGLTGKESNRINASDPTSPEIFVSDDAIFIDSDPGHSIQAIREQIFGSNDTSADPAPMNGFVQQANSMGVDGMNKTVMSGFKPELLPVYTELVNEFAVFDKWFASVPASTQPNRFYVHSATSHGASSNVRSDLIHGFPQKTIFDSLDENDLSFGIYYQNIPATMFFKSLRKLKHITKFYSYKLKFERHAKRGKLPNYVVVEQRYFDVKVLPANDDHPSHDVAIGQRFVKEVYEILRASPQWKEMALLFTYDEHGGFYDHVPTPVSGVPNPDGIFGPEPFYFRFDRLGVRVPSILVSPWVDKGMVIHEPSGPTPDSQFEHSSIPATVKKLFNLKSNFLTKRDAWAATFENYFSLRDTPRDDCPEKLPEVKFSLRPWGPREDVNLSEFQLELIMLAAQLNGDYILSNYPDIGCGACYQVRCKIPQLCTEDGVKVVVTDYGEGDKTDFILSTRAYGRLARPNSASALFAYGVVDIEFKRISCQYPGNNLMVKVQENSRFPDYLAVVIVYQAGQNDINAVEVWEEDYQQWRGMRKAYGAVWDTPNPPAGALDLRVLVSGSAGLKWVQLSNVIPSQWKAGAVYETTTQLN